MPAPGMEHTDSTYSVTSDEMEADDLPGLEQDVEETAHSNVAAVIDSELGSLGGPAFVSEGTRLGEITPDSESDEIGEYPLASEGDAPAFAPDGNSALIDGLSQADDRAAMAAPPVFIPRGQLIFPSSTRKDDDKKKKKEKEKEKEKEKGKGQKDQKSPNGSKDPKNNPKSPGTAGGK